MNDRRTWNYPYTYKGPEDVPETLSEMTQADMYVWDRRAMLPTGTAVGYTNTKGTGGSNDSDRSDEEPEIVENLRKKIMSVRRLKCEQTTVTTTVPKLRP